MKKVGFIICFLFFCFNLFSQEEFNKAKLTVVVKGGVNLSDKHKDKSWRPILGYRLGANVDYAFSDYIFFRTGATYSKKGTNYRSDTKKMNYDMQYLTLPVGLGVFIPITEYLNLSFILSAYADLGMSIDAEIEQTGSPSFTLDSWEKANLKRNDIGVSLEAELGYRNFLVGFGLERSYKNITLGHNNEFNKWNNNCLYASIGYKFIIK